MLPTLLIELCNGPNSIIRQRAQDLNDRLLVRTQTGDGVVQLPRVELWQGRHQRHNNVLKLATELALQFGDEVLAVGGLEGFGDLETLHNAPAGQHVNDGLLVGAETLHRLAEGGRIGDRIERIGRVHRGGALGEKVNN